MSLSPDVIRPRLAAVLGDQLEVAESLGSGAFAVVFRARDRFLERDVAVKVLDPELAPSDELQEQFLREARIIARVEHPHIVPLYNAESRGGLLYLVMRLLPGRTLGERLASEGMLLPGEAARLGHEIAQALAAAHQLGIIHRDVKPGNVLLDANGHAIVTDFGVSRLRGTAIDRPGITVGTPGYMSPEQILAGEIDGKADVYSLGVVLFEMLAGRPPFEATSVQALVQEHLTESPPNLATLRPELPSLLVEIVGRTLAKDAMDRPSAAELASALEVARTADALLTPRAARWRRFKRRLPYMGIPAVAGLLLWAGTSMLRQFLEAQNSGAAPRFEASGSAISQLLIDSLRNVAVLGASETPRYVMAPNSRNGDLLIATDSALIVVQGDKARRFARRAGFSLELVGSQTSPSDSGLAIVRLPSVKPETVFTDLSGVTISRLSASIPYILGHGRSEARTTTRIRFTGIDPRVQPVVLSAGAILLVVVSWYHVQKRRTARPNDDT